MPEKELKGMRATLEKIEGALADIRTLPVGSWGPLIDTEARLIQADKYLTQFIALCEKRARGAVMTVLERLKQQLSGCPFIIRKGEKEICGKDQTEVTGFEICAVDWESCPDYQKAVKKAKAAKADK